MPVEMRQEHVLFKSRGNLICCHFHFSVLDLNAFERQNKAEGLGMVTEEGSGIIILLKHAFSLKSTA